jgi:hypothetical protein
MIPGSDLAAWNRCGTSRTDSQETLPVWLASFFRRLRYFSECADINVRCRTHNNRVAKRKNLQHIDSSRFLKPRFYVLLFSISDPLDWEDHSTLLFLCRSP